MPDLSDVIDCIDKLRERAKRTGKISRTAFLKTIQEYGVKEELVSHWFKKNYGCDWSDYTVTSITQNREAAEVALKNRALRLFKENPYFVRCMKPLSGSRSKVRGLPASYYVGMYSSGEHEIIDIATKEVQIVDWLELKREQNLIWKRAKEIVENEASRIAQISRTRRTTRYKTPSEIAGALLGDFPFSFAYIGQNHQFTHDVVWVGSLSEEEIEWADMTPRAYNGLWKVFKIVDQD